MKLCLAAGGDAIRNPDAFLASMSRRQLLEWEAFYTLDPWGGERDDLHAGIVASAIAAAHGVEAPASAFMPDWLVEPQLPSKEEHERKVDRIFASLRAMKAISGSNNSEHGTPDICANRPT